MDKSSLFKLSDLPDSFAVVLLSFSFILLLAPYFSGADFGLFKIPNFTESAKKWLKLIGPILFCLSILSFLPVIPRTNSGATNSNAASVNTINSTPPSESNSTSNIATVPQSPPEMIAIPGGTFLMGRNDGDAVESPQHSVTVGKFFMDRTEVTNAEYAAFIRDTKYLPPDGWSDNKPPLGQEQWPVSNITLDDANAFAAWRSKRDGVTYRLPREDEWEYAAHSGAQNLLYPWGNSWVGDRANVENESPTRVGSYPEGRNRWGVLDLIGNVWEWTSTSAYLYPGTDIKQIPTKIRLPFKQRGWVIIRGGSCYSKRSGDRVITATYRDWVQAITKSPSLGFRLVRVAQ